MGKSALCGLATALEASTLLLPQTYVLTSGGHLHRAGAASGDRGRSRAKTGGTTSRSPLRTPSLVALWTSTSTAWTSAPFVHASLHHLSCILWRSDCSCTLRWTVALRRRSSVPVLLLHTVHHRTS